MNNVELQKFIEVVQANEKLMIKNIELEKENSALKKERAAKELNYTLNLPAMYGCNPEMMKKDDASIVYADTDSLKVMKEGDEE